MNRSASHILIINSNSEERTRLRDVLTAGSEQNRIVVEAETGAAGLAKIFSDRRPPFDCILLDDQLPDIDVKSMLEKLCGDSQLPPCAIIVFTNGEVASSAEWLRSGAQDCLVRNRLPADGLGRYITDAIERFSMSNDHLCAKERFRESDSEFRALLEAAPDPVVIVDQQGIIVLVNTLTTKLFGYAPAELLGQRVGMLMPSTMRVHPAGDVESYAMVPHAPEMRGGPDLIGLRKDGTQFPIEVSLSPLETNHGVLVSSAIRDVSVRNEVEDRLRRSDAQLRFIMDSMPQKISTSRPNGDVDYFNPQCAEFTGLSFDKLYSGGWAQFIHPEDVDEHVRVWKDCIASGRIFEFESRFRRFDGEYRWHFSRALPMHDQLQRIVMWVGSNTDIHDIKVAEAAMQISEVRYRRLFEAAKDGILILDFASGKIVDSNPFMSDLLGYSHGEFLGKELWEIGLFQDRAANMAAVRSLQETGYVRYEHLPLESTGGQAVEVEIVANAYREADQQVIQCNIRDITERSRLERLLQAQALELSNLHLRKDEFLAMLSHELRSPLAPIANAVQLLSLQRETESRIQHQARSIIERQLGKLQHLVDDLLEVSRITSGRVQLRQEMVTVSGIAEGALETVRPLIEQRHHKLTVSLPIEPIWLHADAARLEQVFVNLLTNAAKYTEEGGRVWLTIQKEGAECVIRVRDSGVGISPTLLPYVFDLFTQADRTLDRTEGGLGIGLALVRRLTELHGGTVEALSESGIGSEFIVRLPLPAEESPLVPEIAAKDAEPVGALRVLVVDDNVDTVHGFSLLLKAYGHDVQTATNGVRALEIAAEYRPHVMLLDIGLPGLNGYEVAKQIRQQPTGKNIVLIALTGYGRDSDRRTSAEAGFNHHLVKPAKFDQLQQILATVEIS